MITYQIDRIALQKLNAEIKEMGPVLAEIAPTLQMLQDAVNQHAATISTPAVDEFRRDLQDLINKAIGLTRASSEDIHKLVSVSDQAGKHLAAIEEHFGAALRDTTHAVAEKAAVEA